MHGTGDYTITDLAELFNISRPTVYCTLAAAPMLLLRNVLADDLVHLVTVVAV